MFAVVGLNKFLAPTVWGRTLLYLHFHPVPIRRVYGGIEQKDFPGSLLPGIKQIEQRVRRK